jgi:hypothetical protein
VLEQINDSATWTTTITATHALMTAAAPHLRCGQQCEVMSRDAHKPVHDRGDQPEQRRSR